MPRIKGIPALTILSSIFVMFFVLTNLAQANVDLLYFRAQSGTDSITLEWETASELDNLGFNILRTETDDIDDAEIINPLLIQSLVGGQPIGAYYEWLDENVESNMDYLYWLQDIDFNGNIETHGPVEASITGGNTIPTVPAVNTSLPTETATGTPEPTPSPTFVLTTQGEPTLTATPRTVVLPTLTPTIVQLTAITVPAQPIQSEAVNQQGIVTVESETSAEPTDQPAPSSPDLSNNENTTLEVEQPQSPEVVGDMVAEQEVAESQQDPPPSITQAQPASAVKSESPARGNSRATELENTESDDNSSSTSTTTLALIILAAALLLAMGAGIAIWLVLKPQIPDQSDE